MAEQRSFAFVYKETEKNPFGEGFPSQDPATGQYGEGGRPSAAIPLMLDPLDRCRTLEDLAALAAGCRRCSLREGCQQVVFGEGDPNARIMLVGEGPGAEEDRLGRPFVGRAGQLLDRILASVGFSRDEVYITNVVMCRPPGNRIPTAAEIDACLPYLKARLRLIRPDLLVCLGSTALRALLHPGARITALRGRWQEVQGVRMMPTYHPAALLRDETKKRPVWEDFKEIRNLYDSFAHGKGPDAVNRRP